MFEKVKLVNFQKHENVTVEFSPTVTSLVGKSKAGKSAILRALLVLCLNTKIRKITKHDKPHAKIILKVDGHTIVRTKGEKVNVYKLDGKVFKAFGSKVPRDIERLLNVSYLNFQRQLDSPFWFTESAGQVSKNLNQIVNLGEIDNALSNVASNLRKEKATVEITSERLQSARTELKELRWVPDFVRSVESLARLQTEWASIAIKRSRLRKLYRGVQTLTLAQKNRSEAMLEGKKAVSAGRVWVETAKRANTLRELVKQLRIVNRTASVKVPDIGPLKAIRLEADKIADRRRTLEAMVVELQHKEKQWQKICDQLEVKKRLLQKQRKVTCPVCGQSVSSQSLVSSLTSTCPSKHQSPEQRKEKSGLTSKPVTWTESRS